MYEICLEIQSVLHDILRLKNLVKVYLIGRDRELQRRV